jgi:nucleotide-binding universal stress UspA family protein
MSITAALLLIGAAWLVTGVVLALIMGRRGYDPFVWWLLGTLLGPVAVVLALVSTRRRRGRAPVHPIGGRVEGRVEGRVDLLGGLDGSTHAVAALHAALDLLGNRLGRVTLATVLPFGESTQRRLDSSAARARLKEVAASLVQRGVGGVPAIVLLSGYPPDELERVAIDEGYDLLVVGARGAGLSTALLGSTATTLAARGRVPVLVAGGDAARLPSDDRRPSDEVSRQPASQLEDGR